MRALLIASFLAGGIALGEEPAPAVVDSRVESYGQERTLGSRQLRHAVGPRAVHGPVEQPDLTPRPVFRAAVLRLR